ncbi:hypothetical protein GCM10010446_64610 [Streptomyces enissocaesilis]|uniref:HTH cro/C1-type domain-containing protein n=1 Tax=Streptomyces enissocaesilis TaxID=332589 RepID=A0ABN3XQA1_9ACTN
MPFRGIATRYEKTATSYKAAVTLASLLLWARSIRRRTLVLATRLKTLREAAGMTRRVAAEALGAHAATVRRIELAETSLDEGQVHTLLKAYGAGLAEIERVLGQLARANLPGW